MRGLRTADRVERASRLLDVTSRPAYLAGVVQGLELSRELTVDHVDLEFAARALRTLSKRAERAARREGRRS